MIKKSRTRPAFCNLWAPKKKEGHCGYCFHLEHSAGVCRHCNCGEDEWVKREGQAFSTISRAEINKFEYNGRRNPKKITGDDDFE